MIIKVKSKFDIFTKDDLPEGKLLVKYEEGLFETSKKKIEKTLTLVKEFENKKNNGT